MDRKKILNATLHRLCLRLSTLVLGFSVGLAAPVWAADPAPGTEPEKLSAGKKVADKPVAIVKSAATPRTSTIDYAPQVNVAAGKSMVLRLPRSAVRVSVGNPEVADVIMLNKDEIYVLGKKVGATNLIVWSKTEQTTVVDVVVGMDAAGLQGKLNQFLPDEKNITVSSASDSLVLSGSVSDAVKVDRAMALAEAFGAKKVVNLLHASAPQQVMLEVKVAEVRKTLSDKLGAGINYVTGSGSGLLAGFLTGAAGVVKAGNVRGGKYLTLDAAKTDGLVKILAEPNIMAMSGQEGAFLAGGKIYIPVPQSGVGGTTITLEEKEFGVGLKFTPTVLEGGRINLKVSPEVSELGTNITVGTQIIPSITTRRASTTVQLNDGQSFAIGGLIKNNVTETMAAFPGLGEMPILGALFRSSDFQNDRSELLFVITPHLVKPLPPNYALPTDAFIEPTRGEFFLEGKLEGASKEPKPAEEAPKAATEPKAEPAGSGGFQMK